MPVLMMKILVIILICKDSCNKDFQRESDFGILIDATGIPSSVVANKINGIRAATCYNSFSARSSRLTIMQMY